MTTIDLWEVITTDAKGRAYGQTFHDNATAHTYARTMRRFGYETDTSPVFGTQPDLTTAIEMAALFYEDAGLDADARGRKEHGL